jgi:protease II
MRSIQVILDGNELASHSAYLNIATIKVTKNHQRMAYIIDTTAEEKYEARFVDLSTGQEWPVRKSYRSFISLTLVAITVLKRFFTERSAAKCS